MMIGGGSGEHPMFIIYGLTQCLMAYNEYMGDEDASENDAYLNFEYESDWGIECSYNIFPKIKKIMDKHGINSAEKVIMLAIGDFLRQYGKNSVEPYAYERSQQLTKKCLNIISFVDKDNYTLGKAIVGGKVKWGVSFFDEHKYINTK
jgi:hypothetical protein